MCNLLQKVAALILDADVERRFICDRDVAAREASCRDARPGALGGAVVGEGERWCGAQLELGEFGEVVRVRIGVARERCCADEDGADDVRDGTCAGGIWDWHALRRTCAAISAHARSR